MAYLLTGKDEWMAAWAASRIPYVGTPEMFGDRAAVIGVMTGDQRNDRLMAVVVFHRHVPRYEHCQVSLAAADPRWVTRRTVRALLAVPFMQFGCNKVWVVNPHTSERAIRLANALGFTREATLADHFGPGSHAVVCRMKAKEYERKYLAGNQKAA